jgi:gliding motility-associated protein GldM
MIAMMYLVLTALLALNVSKEILDAFLIVNESIETTNISLKNSIDNTYSEFSAQASQQPEKVQAYYDLALKVQQYSKDMVDYIENIKAEVISRTDKITLEEARGIDVHKIKRKDNYDVPTVYFITPEAEGGQEMAVKLKNELASYKENILNIFSPESREIMSANIGLVTDGDYRNRDNKPESWERHNFYHTILTADITILNKLIAEVRNAEAKSIDALFANVTKTDFTFDKVDAAVIPKSNYILQGGQFEATIFLAALDTKNPLEVEIGGQKLTGDSGVYNYKTSGGAVGERTVEGEIVVTKRTGETKRYPFTTSYIVAPPSATVSATKMNVFYRDLVNPVSVSVPGVAKDKIRVSMSGGSIRSGGEAGYEVTVTEGTKATITVSAEIDGQSRVMGTYEFRIKRLPTPIAKVSGQTTGSIGIDRLKQAGFVTAELENFLFEGIRYDVKSFTFSAKDPSGLLKEERVTGNQLNAGAKNLLNRLRPGSKVYFEDIRAQGPGGTVTLQPIILRLR